jgi:hypothetical protein
MDVPPKKMENLAMTVAEAGLLNTAVLQRML